MGLKGRHIDKETMENMAKVISKSVTENIIEYLDESKKKGAEEEVSDDSHVCQPCLLITDNKDRPQKIV